MATVPRGHNGRTNDSGEGNRQIKRRETTWCDEQLALRIESFQSA